jgi:hypothetical protein
MILMGRHTRRLVDNSTTSGHSPLPPREWGQSGPPLLSRERHDPVPLSPCGRGVRGEGVCAPGPGRVAPLPARRSGREIRPPSRVPAPNEASSCSGRFRAGSCGPRVRFPGHGARPPGTSRRTKPIPSLRASVRDRPGPGFVSPRLGRAKARPAPAPNEANPSSARIRSRSFGAWVRFVDDEPRRPAHNRVPPERSRHPFRCVRFRNGKSARRSGWRGPPGRPRQPRGVGNLRGAGATAEGAGGRPKLPVRPGETSRARSPQGDSSPLPDRPIRKGDATERAGSRRVGRQDGSGSEG